MADPHVSNTRTKPTHPKDDAARRTMSVCSPKFPDKPKVIVRLLPPLLTEEEFRSSIERWNAQVPCGLGCTLRRLV